MQKILDAIFYVGMIVTLISAILLVASGKNIDEIPQPIVVIDVILFIYVVVYQIINKV
jgi:hypothetical protein